VTRIRRPDVEGLVERDGVTIAWAQYGTSGPHVVLLPTWSVVDSRVWKAQVPYLAQHYRVTTFDGRGNGRSDRPRGAAAYGDDQYVADTVAVLDAAGVDAAVLVGVSMGGRWGVRVAAQHPERVRGLFAIAPSCAFATDPEPADPLPGAQPEPEPDPWADPLATTTGWAKHNKHYWLEGGPEAYDDFLRFFFGQVFSEPHSSKQIEDSIGWAHDTQPAVLVDTVAGRMGIEGAVRPAVEPFCAAVRCPVVVLHGTHDRLEPASTGVRLAELTGGRLLLVEGAGHGLQGREPVLVNREIRAFVDGLAPSGRPCGPGAGAIAPGGGGASADGAPPGRRSWTRALRRPPRALYLSSPIGLGHARRDLAIARELRTLRPDLRVDWLAQDPVTQFLTRHGEQIHPASARLASESAHVDSECGEHDLHAFQTVRRMDEILVHNMMLFLDLLDAEHYDLVVADEAWEVDHFLHENPELKRTAYAWMTDFVGWLPMPQGGPAEAALTADYNAEMIEQRARFRRLRDRSVFVGDAEDVVDLPFGEGLPNIRDWTRDNFDFAGYVTGFTPLPPEERADLRARLGYRPDERVCIVSAGGSGVGVPLLRRVVDAVPILRRQVPDLRVVLVAGPRIDPAGLPATPGLEIRGFLPDLHQHLAVCDVAVVHGGLTTCMELTAHQRPFVYVPLQRHFEQNVHVRHRLERYRAGTCLEYDTARDPDALAAAVAAELARGPADYLPVAADGAARAARLIADVL